MQARGHRRTGSQKILASAQSHPGRLGLQTGLPSSQLQAGGHARCVVREGRKELHTPPGPSCWAGAVLRRAESGMGRRGLGLWLASSF